MGRGHVGQWVGEHGDGELDREQREAGLMSCVSPAPAVVGDRG